MGSSIGSQKYARSEQDSESDNKPGAEFQPCVGRLIERGVFIQSCAKVAPKLRVGSPTILPAFNDLFMWSLKLNAHNVPVGWVLVRDRPHFGQLIIKIVGVSWVRIRH
jgi:hypothetical protein